MNAQEAAALIRPAVDAHETPGSSASWQWADLGAGTGTFTLALATLLGPHAVIHAIERDSAPYSELAQLDIESALPAWKHARIKATRGDFTGALDFPPLDGILLANSLHYVSSGAQGALLRQLSEALTSGGRLVLVEYDRSRANAWVPFPIPSTRLAALADAAGMDTPAILGRAPSAYGEGMYCALFRRGRGTTARP